MTDNMTYETYKEVPHQHCYDVVIKWRYNWGLIQYTVQHELLSKDATRVMCSDCLDVKELN